MEQYPTRKSRRSSGRSAPRTVIELRSSGQHRNLIIAVHVCAGCAIPWIALPVSYLMMTGLFILVSLLVTLKITGRETDSISLRQNGDLFLRAGRGTDWRKVDISSAFVAGWLIVLKLSDASRHDQNRLVCFPDSMSRDDFRRLTVFVRLYGPACARDSIEMTL